MPETETIHIDSLAYGGWGVGRINSKVVFVGYAVPEDVLKIEISDEHKSYAFARIVEITEPSPKRIPAVCPHFGVCGGCGYLNMPYEEEIYWKTEIFKKEFKKIFTPKGENINSFSEKQEIDIKICSSGDNYLNYRQKIGLKIYPPHIGFYKKLTHHVTDIEYCYLAKESINGMLREIRSLLSKKPWKDAVLNSLSSITLTDAGLKNIIFGVKNNPPELNNFSKEVMKIKAADNIFFEFPDKKIVTAQNTVKRDNNYFTVNDKKFSYDLPTFIQVNKKQNENIIAAVTEYLKDVTAERGQNFLNALDLYCGYGNITLFLTRFAANITGVESSGFSVKLGEKNLALNGIDNIKFIKSDVAEFVSAANITRNKKTYDLIVLDPPRAGVKGLVPKIAGLCPEYVIYVSCDTMTLLRDLKIFVETGYIVEKINLVDMFPRTFHLEHIAFLKKSPNK